MLRIICAQSVKCIDRCVNKTNKNVYTELESSNQEITWKKINKILNISLRIFFFLQLLRLGKKKIICIQDLTVNIKKKIKR